MPTPTPRGILPPAVDAVPIPDFIASQTTPLVVQAGDEKPKPNVVITRQGKQGKPESKHQVNPAAYIYAMGYRRGWTDSAAHYFIEEELEGEAE